MVATPTTPATPKKTVSPRHALLEELIEMAVKQASDQFLDLANKLAGALIDATDGDTKQIQERLRAGNQLRNRNFAFLHLATGALEKALRREIAELAPASKEKVREKVQALSLVSLEEMDNKVAMSGVSKPFEALYADALQTLNVRLAFLMDRDILRVSQNPFRPEVFLGALQEAWIEFDPEEESAGLLQPLLKPGMFIEMGPMLEALSLTLQTKGVLPGGVDGYKRRKADAAKPAAGKSNNQAALAQQLRQFFADSDVAGSAAGQIVDGIASGMLQGGVDLSIPELPAAALSAGSGWVPNVGARVVGAAAVAGMSGAAAQPGGLAAGAHAGMVVPGGVGLPAHGVAMMGVPVAGNPGGVLAAPGFVAAGVPGGMPGAAGFAAVGGGGGGVAVAPGFVVGGAPVGAVGGDVAGVWTQGPAQGFQTTTLTNEELQRLSQIHAKQPLLAYLAELQKAVPYESIGSLAARAGGGGQPSMAGAAVGETGGAGGAGGARVAGGAVGSAGAGGGAGAGAERGHGPGAEGGPGPGLAMGAGNTSPGTLPANVFHLPNLKQTMPQGSLSRADESTIDLLSAVFDTVFRDHSISPETRELIRFLQIPVLKAALVDKNFFFQEAHPARRLLELLSRMGWEQRKGPDDPLFQAMQRSVDRVGRDYEQEVSVFTEAVNELEAQIQAEEKASAAAIAAPIAAALKQEKIAESTKLAKNAVALRIGTGEVVAVVEAFLEQRWVSVLTIAYSIEDEKPGAVNNATQTMDDLIWSVRPKVTGDERKQLIARLPGLLSTLNKWLDVIKWQDADRLQFFADLAECHASIVRAPIEMSPERQVEIAMQVAQQAAERRLELQAKAEAEEQARAEQAPADPEEEDAIIEVDSLTRGMWLEFEQEDGSARKVKLAWISPRRTLYIFSTAARQEAFSMAGDELAKRFRDGSAQVLRAEGLVTVALAQALARGADNDDTIATPAAAG